MELIKLINELQKGLKYSNIITDDILIIKDEDYDLTSIRDNIKDYRGWIHIIGADINTKGSDNFRLAIGVSALSSETDEQYIQVVAKSIHILKQALLYTSFIKDEDIEDLNITTDSLQKEDVIVVSSYSAINVEINNAYS